MLPLIGAAIGAAGTIGNIIGSRKANKRLEQLIGQNPRYQSNPLASQRLALAQQLLNARQPGAASAERNIYGSQANAMSNINKNATDAAQALALSSGVQGQTNQAFGDLAQQEAQGYQQRYQNLSGAQQGMIEEGDKVYQDQVRRFQDLASIRGAQTQNNANMWNTVSNTGFGLMNFGLAGGGNALTSGFGGNRSANQGAGATQNPLPASVYKALSSMPIFNT